MQIAHPAAPHNACPAHGSYKEAQLMGCWSVCGALCAWGGGGWVATQRPVNCSLLCMCIAMGVAHHALESHSVEVLGPVVPEDVGCAVGAGSTPVLDLCHLKQRRMVKKEQREEEVMQTTRNSKSY